MVFNFCKSGEFHDQNTGLFLTAKGQHLSLSAHHLSLLYIPGRSNWNPGQRLHLVTRTWHAKPTKIGEDWVGVTQSKPQKQRNVYFFLSAQKDSSSKSNFSFWEKWDWTKFSLVMSPKKPALVLLTSCVMQGDEPWMTARKNQHNLNRPPHNVNSSCTQTIKQIMHGKGLSHTILCISVTFKPNTE